MLKINKLSDSLSSNREWVGHIMERPDYGTSIASLPRADLRAISLKISSGSHMSAYELPVDDSGKVKAADLFDSIFSKFTNHAFVFYDTETTGLPNQLPNVQITQVSAVAVGLKDFIEKRTKEEEQEFISTHGGYKPEYLGHIHGTADLTEDTIKNLDTARGGPTVRAILEFNRYPLDRFVSERNISLPPKPLNYKPLERKPTKDFESELGPAIEIPTSEMPPDFKPESDLLEEFIEFVRRISSSYKVVLVAHNAPFDREFISRRCRIYGINDSALKKCDNLDSQEFMQVYVDSVIDKVNDRDIVDRFSKLLNGKPNYYNLDYVNSALGILNKDASHTSAADVKALVTAVSKLMLMLKYVGQQHDIDIRPELETSIKKRRSLKDRSIKKKQERIRDFEFKKKYVTPDAFDTPEIQSLKKKMYSLYGSDRKQHADQIQSLTEQMDSIYRSQYEDAIKEKEVLEYEIPENDEDREILHVRLNELNRQINRLESLVDL
jgi:hypothetical protein